MYPPLGFTPKGGKVCKLKKGFVCVEAVAKGMVWKVKLLNEGVWFSTSDGRSHFVL